MIEYLEVRVDARREERERLTQLARRKPWWSYVLFVLPYLLRAALYVAGGVGALMCLALAAIFVLLLAGMQPR